MKKLLLGASALCLTAATAQANGIDRSGQPIGIIFEEGTYGELSFGSVSPSVSGTQLFTLGASPTGAKSRDATDRYNLFSGAFKHDFTDQLSASVIIDQPFGAQIGYEDGTGYFADCASADFRSAAVTSILRYKFNENFSMHGGLRYQQIEAEAFIPYVSFDGTPYDVTGDQDGGWGYLVGAAYEIPDIALRIALTYNSSVQHTLDVNESSSLALDRDSTTDIETPQSVNLDFQTGIAPDTLLFGNVRWVNWSEFEIAPDDYVALTAALTGTDGQPLVEYESDRTTYTLGVGRRFNDQWAGSVAVGYMPDTGDFASNLGPTDGFWSLGVGAEYTMDNVVISGGVRYIWIGDAQTEVGPFSPATDFEDNDAIAFGVKIGYTF